MSSENNNIFCAIKVPTLTSKRIVLPLDMILYLPKYMTFEVYRNFIRAMWPCNDENEIIRAKLWQLSTHKFETKFLNGEQLKIEYNFDPERTSSDRVLINLTTMLPVFGGIFPPATEEFTSVLKLNNFISMHVNLDMCSGRKHASCRCYRVRCGTLYDEMSEETIPIKCEQGYFHHYCSKHVKAWLNFYLLPFILLQATGNSLNEDMTEQFLFSLHNTVYWR